MNKGIRFLVPIVYKANLFYFRQLNILDIRRNIFSRSKGFGVMSVPLYHSFQDYPKTGNVAITILLISDTVTR